MSSIILIFNNDSIDCLRPDMSMHVDNKIIYTFGMEMLSNFQFHSIIALIRYFLSTLNQ
jgi:hypothetical protein